MLWYTLSDLVQNGNALAYYVTTSWLNTIEYFCFPRSPDMLVTNKWWKILKLITVTTTKELAAGKSVLYAWGSPDFSFYATDLTYVDWLSYV